MYEVIVVLSGGIEQMTVFNDLDKAKAYADKCVEQDGAISATVRDAALEAEIEARKAWLDSSEGRAFQQQQIEDFGEFDSCLALGHYYKGDECFFCGYTAHFMTH